MQVGKGLKRATGRDEWDQHHRRDSYILCLRMARSARHQAQRHEPFGSGWSSRCSSPI